MLEFLPTCLNVVFVRRAINNRTKISPDRMLKVSSLVYACKTEKDKTSSSVHSENKPMHIGTRAFKRVFYKKPNQASLTHSELHTS